MSPFCNRFPWPEGLSKASETWLARSNRTVWSPSLFSHALSMYIHTQTYLGNTANGCRMTLLLVSSLLNWTGAQGNMLLLQESTYLTAEEKIFLWSLEGSIRSSRGLNEACPSPQPEQPAHLQNGTEMVSSPLCPPGIKWLFSKPKITGIVCWCLVYKSRF